MSVPINHISQWVAAGVKAIDRLGDKLDDLTSLGKGGELAVAKLIELMDEQRRALEDTHGALMTMQMEAARLRTENKRLRAALDERGVDPEKVVES